MYQRTWARRWLAAVMLSLFITVGLGVAAPAPASAVQYKGSTYPTLSCTSTGITWSGVTRGFRPNATITYRYEIYRNNVRIYSNSKGTYTTDRNGDHWRLPSGFPQAIDCGDGAYKISMWTTTSGWRTYAGGAVAWC